MASGGAPRKELPILIEYVQGLDHHDYGSSDETAAERRPLAPEEVWLQAALIPASPPAQSAWPGTTVGVAAGISSVALTPVGNSEVRFESADGHLLDAVPANYSGGAYTPTLVDAAGRGVPYDPSVWVLDGLRRVVEFKYSTPAQLGYAPPFSLAYWRYTGAFPAIGGGGGGSVTGAANVGSGAPVFRDATAGVLNFRTLNAGPGLGVYNNSPFNEIKVSADEASPLNVSAVPDTLDIYVSYEGKETGSGTLDDPYRTFQRAFRDIRVRGYNSRATVWLVSGPPGGGATYPPLPLDGVAPNTGVVSLIQGTRGRRDTPVSVRGQRTKLNGAPLTILSVTPDPVTSLVTITLAVGFANALGCVVRFTSGALAAYQAGPEYPATAVEVFVARADSSTVYLLPLSALPAPGDTLDIYSISSTVAVAGTRLLHSGRQPLIIRDIGFELTGDNATFGLHGSVIGLTGVVLNNLSPAGQLVSVSGRIAAGRGAAALESFGYSALGLAVYNSNPAFAFSRVALDATATFDFTNSVFLGNATNGGSYIYGPVATAADNYFSSFSLELRSGCADIANTCFAAGTPREDSAPLAVVGAAGANITGCRVLNSTYAGLHVADGAVVNAAGFAVDAWVLAGILCERGAFLGSSDVAFGEGSGPNLRAVDGARVVNAGALTGGVSVDDDGFYFGGNSHLSSGDLICNGCGGSGLNAVASTLTLTGALTCNGNASVGVAVSRDTRIFCDQLDANNNQNGGLYVALGSSITCRGTITADNNVGNGLECLEGGSVSTSGTLARSNTAFGIRLSSGASLTNFTNIEAQFNTSLGVLVESLASLKCSGHLNCPGNTGGGLHCIDSTVQSGDFTANGVYAARYVNSRVEHANVNLTSFTGATAYSVQEGSSVNIYNFSCPSPVLMPGGVAVEVLAASRLVVRSEMAVSSSGGRACNVWGGSMLLVAGTLQLNNCQSLDVAALIADSLVTAFTLQVNNCLGDAVIARNGGEVRVGLVEIKDNAGIGLQCLAGSRLSVANECTLTNNLGGILLDEGSQGRLNLLTAEGSTGGDGFQVAGGSSLAITESVTLNNNAGNGSSVLRGSRLASRRPLAGSNNIMYGLRLESGSSADVETGSDVSGNIGAVLVGGNLPASWASLAGRNPVNLTDYSVTPSQLCAVSIH